MGLSRLAGIATAVVLIAAACGDSGTTTTVPPATAPPATTPPATTAPTTLPPAPTTTLPPTTEPPPPALDAGDVVTIGGLGPVRVGMSVEEATAAAGLSLVGEPDINPDCYFVVPEGLPGVLFMVTDGTIARVDITEGSITTRSGAGIGSTEDEITAMFPDKIEVSPHAYVDGNYLTFVPVDPGDDQYRVVFETDGSAVTSYRAGRIPEVEFIEGCA